MKLISLRLRNICQHRELQLEFRTGVVGLVGSNGSGKSNAMNVACYSAVTGDYSRHEQNKGGMVCQQAGEGETAFIELTFEQDGTQYRVYRGLQKPAKNELHIPGLKKPLKKANEIQAHIEDVLGIQRRLIEDYVFVKQNELFAFLSQVPSERAKSFAHLCDTIKAEQIWALLGDQITADLPLASRVIDTTDDIREVMGGYEGRVKKLRMEMVVLRRQVLGLAEIKKYEDAEAKRARQDVEKKKLPERQRTLLSTHKAAKVASDAVAAQKTSIAECAEAVKTVKGVAVRLRTELARRTTKANVARASLATLTEQVNRYEEKRRLQGEVTNAEEAVEVLTTSKPELEKGTASKITIVSWEADVETYLPRIASMQQLVDTFEMDEDGNTMIAECPLCGTSSDDLADCITEAQETLPELKKELSDLREKLAKHRKARRDYDVEHRGWDTDRKLAAQTSESVRTQLAKVAYAKPVVAATKQKHERSIQEEKGTKHSLNIAENNLETCRTDEVRAKESLSVRLSLAAAARTKHEAAMENLQACREEIRAAEVSEKDLQAAKAALSKHRVAELAMAGCKATVEELVGFIEDKKEELAQANERLARSQRAREWVQLITQVRDEVMHRDKLPFVVHKNYLQGMVEAMNEVLAEFRAPFHVTTSADVGFTAHFVNGTVMPAPGLSGGQKVVLALAFRLTVNSLFAPQLGTMVLDEPTDGLDTENRLMAAEFFQELGSMAKSRNLQVVVITHDDALERIFDQKIVLASAV